MNANGKKAKLVGRGLPRAEYYVRDLDHAYFRKNFARLVREHGGEWIVLARGKLIGTAKRAKLAGLVSKARAGYPGVIPFIAPIPTRAEIECVL